MSRIGKILSLSLVVLLVVLSVRVVSTRSSGSILITPLIAGKHVEVGTVTVWNDGENLYVKYNTTGGWVLTETHLAVATSLEGIPQTRSGNPIVGLFSYRTMHPLVTEFTYVIALSDLSVGTELYIAAHAEVLKETSIVIVSDTDTLVTCGNVEGATYPHNAVYAWEPVSDTDPSRWDENVDYDFSESGADWIWESYRVVNPIDGDIVCFERTFDIENEVLLGLVKGTLRITCDNSYEAYLNDEFIGSAQLGEDWRTSDLTESYVNTQGWQTVENYDISDLLKKGQNTLKIVAANEYMGPLDDQKEGTVSSNPAGLIFELRIFSIQEETAWGKGYDFPGRNWAMYFVYTVSSP